MATNSVQNYSDNSTVKDTWLNQTAPHFFDLDNVNNYTIGIYGFTSEIIANAIEDGFNAISVARREFYPTTAKFTSSLYDMATLQQIGVPLASPATCRCALILDQDEVIENSTFNSGVGECVIDSTLKLFADNLQFMIDYPIIILSKQSDKWSHTIYYDTTVKNSLSTSTSGRYISNQVISSNGKNYLILFLDVIRQLEMTEVTNIVVKDNALETFNMTVDFTGDLANFEVFYKETPNSPELQLTKIMVNEITPSNPYVQYKFITDSKLRLSFVYNTIFNPTYNAEVICRLYTTEGSDGNFNTFSKDLPCTTDSDKYPYNNTMTFVGKVNGSASGGSNKPSIEEMRETIIEAYSTNNTITTSQDLQTYFNTQTRDLLDTKVLFRKKRDDFYIRLFGAYTTMKDISENVIPTNTLEIESFLSDYVEDIAVAVNRVNIPPGTLFEYKSADSFVIVPIKKPDGTLASVMDLRDGQTFSSDRIIFTNPFLIGINIDPNNVGYYMNSINSYNAIEYTYVNDDSLLQFIAGTTSIYRNGISRSNYYKIAIQVAPTTDLDHTTVVKVNDPLDVNNQIIATYNGTVMSEEYYFDDVNDVGYIRYNIKYDTTEPDNTLQIQTTNTLPIGKTSTTGYKMKYKVGDSFIAGDILATKRVDDLGNLLICGDLSNELYSNDYYIPFSIQDYVESANAYILEAYLSTDDIITTDENLAFNYGIYRKDGTMEHFISVPMRNQTLQLNTLYNNVGNNITNKYSSFVGLSKYTLTNTYSTLDTNKFDFITALPFIRGVVEFYPGGVNANDFQIVVSESPMVGALWASSVTNYDYFVSQYNLINSRFYQAFYALENNFSIDSKFYNTYGKARFFTVGNNESTMVPLNSVKCSFRFGVRLNTVASNELFVTSVRNFIKAYIEDTASLTSTGRDIYIMNLIADIKANFSEILYMEYYGMNIYDYSAQKIVGPLLTDYWKDFIPEFINLDTLYDSNGIGYPNIEIDILSS